MLFTMECPKLTSLSALKITSICGSTKAKLQGSPCLSLPLKAATGRLAGKFAGLLNKSQTFQLFMIHRPLTIQKKAMTLSVVLLSMSNC